MVRLPSIDVSRLPPVFTACSASLGLCGLAIGAMLLATQYPTPESLSFVLTAASYYILVPGDSFAKVVMPDNYVGAYRLWLGFLFCFLFISCLRIWCCESMHGNRGHKPKGSCEFEQHAGAEG